jgi:creatinine amidohydrolase
MDGVPHRWADMAAPSVVALLAADPGHVALVPVGATEQHGPHLPTGTDSIIAGALCDRVSAATGALVLPPVDVGTSAWHGPDLGGTLAVAAEHLVATIEAYAEWAWHSGVRRMLLVNGHVGNTPALAIASDRIRARPDVPRIGLVEWWALPGPEAAEVTADATDWHANRAETALMLALAPDLVDMTLAASADDVDRSDGLAFRYTATQMTANGVTGRPSEATAALGDRLLRWATREMVAIVERGRHEVAPIGLDGRPQPRER